MNARAKPDLLRKLILRPEDRALSGTMCSVNTLLSNSLRHPSSWAMRHRLGNPLGNAQPLHGGTLTHPGQPRPASRNVCQNHLPWKTTATSSVPPMGRTPANCCPGIQPRPCPPWVGTSLNSVCYRRELPLPAVGFTGWSRKRNPASRAVPGVGSPDPPAACRTAIPWAGTPSPWVAARSRPDTG